MFNYGDIIEYIDGTYDDNFNDAQKWCNDNNATFDELIERRKYDTITVIGENDESATKTVLYRYFQINQIPVVEKTLEQCKLDKRAEINRYRNETEQGGFEYMGKMFDSDVISCIRIQGAAQLASQYNSEDININWTSQDNEIVSLSGSEIIGLSNALAMWSDKCHEKATELKKQVDNAQSKEELDNIIW